MLDVAPARQLVLDHARPKAAVELPSAECLGLTLAEDVASDADSPPFDRSMVDGYAIRGTDLSSGGAELTIVEEIMAGAVPRRTVAIGQCARIMTGAPIPPGADAVVMHERTELLSDSRVRIRDEKFRPGQNIMPRAASLRRGQIVLQAGCEIGPVEMGLLAEVGRARPRVIGPITAAVLSTGNELVPADRVPAEGQIRNSNGPMLAAALRRCGARPVELGIARDEPDELRRRLAEGLASDLLIISGGVSAGALDLVPGLLRELGVEEVFHKIRLKPGKPLWFGVRRGEAGSAQKNAAPTLVFGLPGNPVSSLVCFELFVKLALARLAGREAIAALAGTSAELTSEFVHRGDRPTFHPAVLSHASGQSPSVTPLRWAGSADLRGLAEANALAVFPAGDRTFAAGESLTVLPLGGP